MSGTMRAAVLHGREDLRLEERARPAPGAGELVLRVGAALTCGTDLKVFRRGYHAAMLKPPMLFGHEVAGTVAGVGAGVLRFREGDRVVALNSAPCDRCFWCGKGQQNLCEDLLFNNGAYAEYLRVPARIAAKNTLLLPDGLKEEYAALTEPLACVVRGFEESGIQAGDTVAVIGAGPIGLMFTEVAALEGAKVIAVVKREDQEMAARRLGAAAVVRIGEGVDVVSAVRALTDEQRGVDVAVDAVALPATWQQAVSMVRRGGVVNFFGGPPSGTEVGLDTNRLHYGDITLKASFHHTPSACRTAFDLIASGRLQAEVYLTGRAELGEVPELFQAMLTRSAGESTGLDIKTVVLPWGGTDAGF